MTSWHRCLIDPAKVSEASQRTLTAVEELLSYQWGRAPVGVQLEAMLRLAVSDGLITMDEHRKIWRDLMDAGLRVEMAP
jgi:hypothetical protein